MNMIDEMIKYALDVSRMMEENIKLSGLMAEELENFMSCISFSTEQFNKFLKGEFKNGRLKFMYREYLESIGKCND